MSNSILELPGAPSSNSASTATFTATIDATAAARVFALPELLEFILSYLGIKDLLLSQRTCHSFRNTVEGSIRLKRKLFLEPDWNLEGRVFDAYSKANRPGRKPENNSLLLRAFPGCYPTITLVIVSDGADGGHTTLAPGSAGKGRRGSEHWSWDVCISFPADRKPHCPAAADYPEASWRKMYLSQPPCQSLYLVRRWQRSINPAMLRLGGITMGDLFDEATAQEPSCNDRNWHQSYISSDRDWHFEGNIRCSSVEDAASEGRSSEMIPAEYAYSRELQNGRARAFSDDWDPGRAVGFGVAAGANAEDAAEATAAWFAG